ncbi:hypothetical protein I5G63_gp060 [Mycobacterium phage Imvubu]|uniref:Uncharacterized protein n=1 Tax=Mycobacterium phage Imvubu TaxID=2686233 RepID=A0A6B9LDV4_9CAUD|nr:hypothetical protein I5G63_gp060 [Mycobacterium phage Imvubu]QHB37801.1 hypothetical protein PBI_IMVUBU_60 [Mycobacterium phage Imvubu]
MTTTTKRAAARGKKASTPAVEIMDETLEEFAAQMDAHLGRTTGVAEAVKNWRKHTDEANALASRGPYRQAIHDKLDAYIAADSAAVEGQPLGHRRVGGGTRTVLRSAAVSKAHPELWAAARPVMRIMAVKHHLAVPPTLRVPRMRTAAEAWAALKLAQTRATKAKAAANEARELFLAAVDECADVWDGSARLTADGWTVGVTEQQRFSEAVCRQLAQQRGIDLSAVEEETHSDGRLVYALGDILAMDEDAGD